MVAYSLEHALYPFILYAIRRALIFDAINGGTRENKDSKRRYLEAIGRKVLAAVLSEYKHANMNAFHGSEHMYRRKPGCAANFISNSLEKKLIDALKTWDPTRIEGEHNTWSITANDISLTSYPDYRKTVNGIRPSIASKFLKSSPNLSPIERQIRKSRTSKHLSIDRRPTISFDDSISFTDSESRKTKSGSSM